MTDPDLRLALQRVIAQLPRYYLGGIDRYRLADGSRPGDADFTDGTGEYVKVSDLAALLGRAETTQCPHGENCACAISTRHEWFVAFCNERDKVGRAETTDPKG